MQFNSLIFLFLFLPFFLLIYLILKPKAKNLFLIIFSLFFYAWGQREAVFILIILILVNYYFSIRINESKRAVNSKRIYISAIIFNILVLIFYKYLTFILGIFGINFQIKGLPFPTGISFLTFIAISYLTDVYRKVIPFEKQLSSYALYISLFPKLITGPITLYSSFAGQLKKRDIILNDFSIGIKRFIIGIGKKVIIADTLAKTANNIFLIPADHLNMSLSWIGIFAYTLQIYYDFSGYSDMAIGLGRMIGFKIPENFNFPYISESIKDFWDRWHITLGRWLKTYLFLPLAYGVMKRTQNDRVLKIKIENWAYVTGILVTFTLCGFWHGAAWTFIVWGFYYGILLTVEHLGVRKYFKKHLPWVIRVAVTQLFIMIGWVFFRSADLKYAFGFMSSMFGSGGSEGIRIGKEFFLNSEFIFVAIIALFGSFPLNSVVKKLGEVSSSTMKALFVLGENIFYTFIFLLSIVALLAGTYQPFIYFRF